MGSTREQAPSNFTELERRRLSARVLAGRYFQIKTPIAEDYADALAEALEGGEHGAIVYGAPRLGKTMATRWMFNQSAAIFGASVPWLEVPLRAFGASDRDAFFSYLLELVRHRHRNGTVTDKRNRMSRWFAARANRSGVAAFAVFFDEAHVLPARVFRWLLEIDNELDSRGARLFALLVGQPDLLNLRDRIADQTSGDQFVERFMSVEFPFRGLASEAELAACLHGYATTEWPMKSGVTFAEYYIPDLVADGFQLQSIAPAMWRKYESTWRDVKLLRGDPELPMVHVTRAIVLLLNALSDRSGGRSVAAPTPKDVESAVTRSGYADYVNRRLKAMFSADRKVAARCGAAVA